MAATVRCVVGKRDDADDGLVVRPHAFAGSDIAKDSEEFDPYDASAAGLEEAMLAAQLNRLNPSDRTRVRRHLGLVSNTPGEASEDPHANEKALAKMRHPSVARVWKLRPTKPGNDHSVG